MDLDTIKETLETAGHQIASEERTGNDCGTKLTLDNGAIVNSFDNGNYNVQGKNQAAIKALLGGATGNGGGAKKKAATGGGVGTKLGAGPGSSPPTSPPNKKVFVVYGHDMNARTQLEAMLLRWQLEPIILDQLPSSGQTIIEKLESFTGQVGFAVVLATPDDEGHKANVPTEKAFRARQNVVLELGMLLAKLGRPRVAILLKDQVKMERPSDIQGLIYFAFKDDVKEVALALAKEMQAQGYQIDVQHI